MKSVLISIQPKWCELIASGKKTIEVRKTAPKLETPFKCYIYCTKAKEKLFTVMKDGDENYGGTYHGKPIFIKLEDGNSNDMYFKRQKVIGEFVCDKVLPLEYQEKYLNGLTSKALNYFADKIEATCLTVEELNAYGKGKPLYGWHISDLKIYNNPKELGEFKSVKVIRGYHKESETSTERLLHAKRVQVKYFDRPPQSWAYCETSEEL